MNDRGPFLTWRPAGKPPHEKTQTRQPRQSTRCSIGLSAKLDNVGVHRGKTTSSGASLEIQAAGHSGFGERGLTGSALACKNKEGEPRSIRLCIGKDLDDIACILLAAEECPVITRGEALEPLEELSVTKTVSTKFERAAKLLS